MVSCLSIQSNSDAHAVISPIRRRRMNLSKPETIEDIQKEISALTDIVASILNLLDKSIGDAKRVTR